MKCAIDMPAGRISAGKRSHKAAWAYLRAHQHKMFGEDITVLHKGASWDDYDRIYLYHGMEFQGSLNLFGGASNETAMLFQRLIDYKGQLFSLDIPMPDYGTLCKGRLKKCEPHWANTDWDKITEICAGVPHAEHPDFSAKHLVMGDSHAFSAYVPGAAVYRMDCKTIHGACDIGLKTLIENEFGTHEFETLTLYFGNIDVRHHICRMEDPVRIIGSLIDNYEYEILNTGVKKIELVELLPIENESRKLPKTGYYKGQPFHGTWSERSRARDFMNFRLENLCKKHGWYFYKHPKEIVNEKFELDFAAMEVPRSVHLSPEFYRTNLREETPEDSFLAEFF